MFSAQTDQTVSIVFIDCLQVFLSDLTQKPSKVEFFKNISFYFQCSVFPLRLFSMAKQILIVVKFKWNYL